MTESRRFRDRDRIGQRAALGKGLTASAERSSPLSPVRPATVEALGSYYCEEGETVCRCEQVGARLASPRGWGADRHSTVLGNGAISSMGLTSSSRAKNMEMRVRHRQIEIWAHNKGGREWGRCKKRAGGRQKLNVITKGGGSFLQLLLMRLDLEEEAICGQRFGRNGFRL